MKSNDEIPEDEMLLAEACAAAKAAGLRWMFGTPFIHESGAWTRSPSGAVGCCALGALHIAGSVHLRGNVAMPRKHHLANVHAGNDRGESIGWSAREGDRGESLGWAFRCFMTQDESDPATERLIRERSGK